MNILSIDIDFMFKDCINYQQMVDDELPPYLSWSMANYKYHRKNDKYIELDIPSFEFIKQVLQTKGKQAKKIILIEEHDEIYKKLKELDIKDNLVFNIDYHHDISYCNFDGECTLENWVTHCYNDNLLKSYVWIRQPLSECTHNNVFEHCSYCWRDINIDNLPEFDYIYICLSKYFTPYNFWEYWFKLVDIARIASNNEYNINFIGEPQSLLNPYHQCDGSYFLTEDILNNEIEILGERVIDFKNYKILKHYTIDTIYWSFYKTNDNVCDGNELIKFIQDCIDKSFIYEKEYIHILPFEKNKKSEIIAKRFKHLLESQYDISTETSGLNIYYKFIYRGEDNGLEKKF